MRRMLRLVRHCQAIGQEPDAPLTELRQQPAIALLDLKPMMGFGSLNKAKRTLSGIEAVNMIREGQVNKIEIERLSL